MSATIINLIIQLIAGAIGGNAAGATMEKANLGTAGNTIAGALGGLGGGQLLSALIPALAGSAGGVDLASLAGQLVGGGVSGAIVTVIVGMIMNAMKSAARRLLPASEAVDLLVQPTHASLSKGLRARAACPLWVISGHTATSVPCPLYPQ